MGYNQPSILFVVGGNDIPGGATGACRSEASLIGLHVVLPQFSLGNVRSTEFPVLFRFVDACQEALSLLLLREVKKEFDDAGSIAMEVFLQIHDRTIPVVPDLLVVMRRVRDRFAAENLGVHAEDQHLLVIGPIENADLPAFRQIARGAPQKVMF